VTSLYFLDDVKNPTADAQLWSFILTGADYNREIKLWCCVKWECLQTISFLTHASPPGMEAHQQALPLFKTSIDLTSTYLVMSDITRKCFYVLHLFQDQDKKQASCTAISEYLLAYPALSFAIIDSYRVKARKYNQLNTSLSQQPNNLILDDLMNTSDLNSLDLTDLIGSSNNNNNNSSADLCTMIRLYCIQTKQLQEMQIFLTGEQSINAYNNSSTSLSPPPSASQQVPLAIPITNSFTTKTTTTTPSHGQSILHKLLPNASSPIKLNNQQQFLSLSSSSTSLRLKGSASYNSELLLQNNNNSENIQDSAIIQIVTPNLQL